jgi:hypothetical protein
VWARSAIGESQRSVKDKREPMLMHDRHVARAGDQGVDAYTLKVLVWIEIMARVHLSFSGLGNDQQE